LPNSSDPELTIAFAYFDQPLMLRKQVEVFSSYAKETLSRLKLIIVDDCSRKHQARKACKRYPLRTEIYIIQDNIAWNQMGARNLAMKHASGWVLLIDPDHTVSESLAVYLLDEVLPTADLDRYYLIPRVYARKREKMKAPPNLYMIHHQSYWRAGGMDEGFRGHKGWSDITFRYALESTGMKRFLLSKAPKMVAWSWKDWFEHEPPLIKDAAVVGLDRSLGHNNAKRIKIMKAAKRSGWQRYIQSLKPLQFKWRKVFSNEEP